MQSLNTKLGIVKDLVFILINEQLFKNWCVKVRIPADEINLGFKINI
jgi:hypothetical protein